MIEFQILGPLGATEDGRGLPLGGQKQKAALALLLLHAGEVVSTDRLIDALWEELERPPRTASTSLQNFVSQLRKLLGPETLVTRTPGYLLRLEPGQLDADLFRRKVAAAGEAGPEERARLLGEALALWHGPALQDFAYTAWAKTEIDRLEEQKLGALEERLGAQLELGCHAELVGELASLVREHPHRERLRAHLMLALYRAGRQADALETYQSYRQKLVEEGLEPKPALKELHVAILRQDRALEPAAPPPPAPDHYEEVVRAALAGRLVTMLGTGAVLRDGDGDHLPGEAAVAAHLADVFGYPADGHDLPRVSQYVAVTHGLGPLYDELHSLFDRDYAPGPVHRFLAELASVLRAQGAPAQLIVTTAYDLALERAFADAGEEFDVVSYIAVGRDRGRFRHLRPDGTTAVIELPNTYGELPLAERTAILKIHGQVDRSPERDWESFVVSEDDYIDYLAQTDVASVVPVTLSARLRRSHYLFLGYALQEWNLRVFLHRIWRDDHRYRSWAVQPTPSPLEREFWRQQGVTIFDVSLEDYVEHLLARVSVPV